MSNPYQGERDCRTCRLFTPLTQQQKDAYQEGIGFCEWKCPPILKHVLWGEWQHRRVMAGDWCHEHIPVKNTIDIEQPLMLEHRP